MRELVLECKFGDYNHSKCNIVRNNCKTPLKLWSHTRTTTTLMRESQTSVVIICTLQWDLTGNIIFAPQFLICTKKKKKKKWNHDDETFVGVFTKQTCFLHQKNICNPGHLCSASLSHTLYINQKKLQLLAIWRLHLAILRFQSNFD